MYEGSGLDDVVDHTEPNRSGWDHRGGDSDWAESQQHSQGGWSLECCVLLPQGLEKTM